MYITNNTDNVRELIKELELKGDINKLKFIIYIFGSLSNNQINEEDEINPNLIDKDIKIFTLNLVGVSLDATTMFLEYLVMLYNNLTNINNAYIDNGNVIGITYDKDDKSIISKFENLSFSEKLDVLSETIIRYDNETYFTKIIPNLSLSSKFSAFDIANFIQDYKN